MPVSSPAARVENALAKLPVMRVEAKTVPAAKRAERLVVETSGEPVHGISVLSKVANRLVCGRATTTCDWLIGMEVLLILARTCVSAPTAARMLEILMLRLPLAAR